MTTRCEDASSFEYLTSEKEVDAMEKALENEVLEVDLGEMSELVATRGATSEEVVIMSCELEEDLTIGLKEKTI